MSKDPRRYPITTTETNHFLCITVLAMAFDKLINLHAGLLIADN